MRGRVVPAHATTDGGNDRERPVSLAALLYNDHACAENFMVRARGEKTQFTSWARSGHAAPQRILWI